jgi:hypothetical protein
MCQCASQFGLFGPQAYAKQPSENGNLIVPPRTSLVELSPERCVNRPVVRTRGESDEDVLVALAVL